MPRASVHADRVACRVARRLRLSRLLGLALALSLLVGCENERGSDCRDSRVVLAVASSLREVNESVKQRLSREAPEFRLETSFGASSILARQLELGAPIDLFVSADETLVDGLIERGFLDPRTRRTIANGRLVLVARPESPFADAGREALFHPEMKRLGLPGEAVPLGRYGRAWLRSEGLLETLHGKIVESGHARANLRAFEAGHLDLALLYESDARRSPGTRIVFAPPPESYPAIRYVAALATASARCAGPLRVLRAWQSEETRNALAAEGFIPSS